MKWGQNSFQFLKLFLKNNTMGEDSICLALERMNLYLSSMAFSDFEALLPAGASELRQLWVLRQPTCSCWRWRGQNWDRLPKRPSFLCSEWMLSLSENSQLYLRRGKGRLFYKKKERGSRSLFLPQVFSELLNNREKRVREGTKNKINNK